MKRPYWTFVAVILALDQGTTSSRAIVFDHAGQVVAFDQREFAQHFPQPGWVEHDPLEIWRSQLEVARGALRNARVSAADVAAIGITNQRETTILWERATGKPVANAIVWQDRRTAAMCASCSARAGRDRAPRGPACCSTRISPARRSRWLLDHVDGLARARRGAARSRSARSIRG